MAPPQYYAPPPPPQRQVGFLEGWYAFYIYFHSEYLLHAHRLCSLSCWCSKDCSFYGVCVAVLQLYVAAVSWMIVAVTLQLYLSPNDACDYTAQRVWMFYIRTHVRVFVDYIKLLIDEYAISFAIFYYPVLSFWMKFIFYWSWWIFLVHVCAKDLELWHVQDVVFSSTSYHYI